MVFNTTSKESNKYKIDNDLDTEYQFGEGLRKTPKKRKVTSKPVDIHDPFVMTKTFEMAKTKEDEEQRKKMRVERLKIKRME